MDKLLTPVRITGIRESHGVFIIYVSEYGGYGTVPFYMERYDGDDMLTVYKKLPAFLAKYGWRQKFDD